VILRVAVAGSSNIELSNGEANNLWNIFNFLNGKNLYSDPEQLPFEIFQYAPISQLFFAFSVSWIDPANYLLAYKVLRGIVFFLNISLAVYVYYFLIRIFSLNRKISSIISILSLFSLSYMNWIVRPDALSVFIIVISYTQSVAFFKTHKIKNVVYAALTSSTAFFVKQDALQLFVIIPIAFLLLRKYKATIVFVAVLGTSFACLYLSFLYALGEYFPKSIFGGLNNDISIIYSFGVLNRYLQLYLYFPIFLLYVSFRNLLENRDESTVFMSLLVIGAFLFACSTTLKLGAGPNYFSVFQIIGVALVAISITKFKARHGILYIVFSTYFLTGTLFHYLSPAFGAKEQVFEKSKKAAIQLLQKYGENSLFYVTDPYLELHLYKNTIFPNQEFYYVSKFDYSLAKQLPNDVLVIVPEGYTDIVLSEFLQKGQWNVIDKIEGYTIQKNGAVN